MKMRDVEMRTLCFCSCGKNFESTANNGISDIPCPNCGRSEMDRIERTATFNSRDELPDELKGGGAVNGECAGKE